MNFPYNTTGKLFIQLPENLARHHSAVLSLALRPRLPSLVQSMREHAIMAFDGARPKGGAAAISILSNCLESGGSAWIVFKTISHARYFCRDVATHFGLIVDVSELKNTMELSE